MMIENMKCELTHSTLNIPMFRFKWKWIDDGNNIQMLKIVYRSVGEDEILQNSLFSMDAIISHMFKDISEATIEDLVANGKRHDTMTCSLSHGGSIFYEKEVEIDNSGNIYFFYLVDSKGKIFHSFPRKVLKNSKVIYVKSNSIFSRDRTKITIEKNESRRIFLQTEYMGLKSYSLLPAGCREYYVKSEISDFKLLHLTDLINIQ